MEILAALPKLDAADRREILDRLFDLEEQSLLNGAATPEEMPQPQSFISNSKIKKTLNARTSF